MLRHMDSAAVLAFVGNLVLTAIAWYAAARAARREQDRLDRQERRDEWLNDQLVQLKVERLKEATDGPVRHAPLVPGAADDHAGGPGPPD
jgi:hypothetical protein